MELLHDKIFEKLQNVEKQSKRSLPPRSPPFNKEDKAARPQHREDDLSV